MIAIAILILAALTALVTYYFFLLGKFALIYTKYKKHNYFVDSSQDQERQSALYTVIDFINDRDDSIRKKINITKRIHRLEDSKLTKFSERLTKELFRLKRESMALSSHIHDLYTEYFSVNDYQEIYFNSFKRYFLNLSNVASLKLGKHRINPKKVFDKASITNISLDYSVCKLHIKNIDYYFFPNSIVKIINKTIRIYGYSDINCNIHIEKSDKRYSDSILTQSYRYELEDGSPDSRFHYNPCTTKAKIGYLNFDNFCLEVSNTDSLEAFISAFEWHSIHSNIKDCYSFIRHKMGIDKSTQLQIDPTQQKLPNFTEIETLIESIFGLIESEGSNIISSSNFVQLLTDCNAFSESKSLKHIFKRMVNHDVFTKLLTNPSWDRENKLYIQKFIVNTNLDKNTVSTIAERFVYELNNRRNHIYNSD